MVHRLSLATKQLIGASLLSSHPGQTSCLPLVTTFTDTCLEITEPLHREYDKPSSGKRLATFPCGRLDSKYIQTAVTNILAIVYCWVKFNLRVQ